VIVVGDAILIKKGGPMAHEYSRCKPAWKLMGCRLSSVVGDISSTAAMVGQAAINVC
jgi:hypothetical protein